MLLIKMKIPDNYQPGTYATKNHSNLVVQQGHCFNWRSHSQPR